MIHNLDDEVKHRLRVRAAENGRSMEEEARLILREAVGCKPGERNLARLRTHNQKITVAARQMAL